MPIHIKYFEWAWLGSLALGIIVSGLTYSTVVPAAGGNEILTVFIQISVIGITLLLVLLTSRKRSKSAKWILVVLFALGLAFFIPELAMYLEMGFAGVLSSIQVLAQCVGLYFLFTDEARRWFKQKNSEISVSGE